MDNPAKKPAPRSTDFDGWRQALDEDRLKSFTLEVIVAAFQDLRRLPVRDDYVVQSLIKYLSDSTIRMLRSRVGMNHPDNGWDLIWRAHHQIIAALLQPESPDGKGLREAFASRVHFRLIDAYAAELRERRTPSHTAPATHSKHSNGNGASVSIEPSDHADPGDSVDLEACADEIENVDLQEDDGGAADLDTDFHSDESKKIAEQIDLSRVLNRISNPKKRLAFQLFLDEYPFKSKRPDMPTIANAVGVTERTARSWVKEVIGQLQSDPEVLKLRRHTLGEKS